MKISHITINGFKSFAKKTLLDFPEGIISIVGPNGSGKSNISDAIRWGLGETAFKNIRVSNLDNLIFSGSSKSSANNFAEVEIILSDIHTGNSGEVSIRRRISRDSESDFYLNNEAVRLKDIQIYLAGHGIGSGGLTTVNQGEADSILISSPLKRRIMVEEILGLKEFELKKDDAQKKLEKTSINLDKAKSLLEEITPHYRSLSRQIKKFEQREEIVKELKNLQELYFSAKFQRLELLQVNQKPILDKITGDIAKLTNEIRDIQKEINGLTGIKKVESKTKEIEQKINQFRTEKTVLFKDIGRLEAKIEAGVKIEFSSEVLVRKIKHIIAKLNTLFSLDDTQVIFEKIKIIIQDLESSIGVSHKDLTLDKQIDDLHNNVCVLDQEIDRLSNMLEEERRGDEQSSEALHQYFESLNQKNRYLTELEIKKERVHFDLEKFNERLSDLKRELGSFGLEFDENFELMSRKLVIPPEFDIDRAQSRILRLRSEADILGAVDEETRAEYEDVRQRHEFLKKEISDLESAAADLKKLIKELEHNLEKEFDKYLSQINNEFDRYLKLMFGGGKAKLRLVNLSPDEPKNNRAAQSQSDSPSASDEDLSPEEDDEPQSPKRKGLEILVDLPKKKIKGLEMLSGGERALVSIALIFAVVAAYKPPFVLVDEIDAALDETNSRKFAMILKELSDKTQFILITHNRATMEAADVLYGVILHEEGYSKIFSVKLSEAEELAPKD